MSPIYNKLNSIIGDGPDKKSYLGDDDFVKVSYRNIRLSYHVKNRLIDLQKLLGTVRRIEEQLLEALGICMETVEIEIFQIREEWVDGHTHIDEAALPSWVQGDSGRIIRVVMDDEKVSSFEALQVMVTHEIVHRALAQKTNGRIPGWLDEGLAIHFSQDLPEEYKSTLERAIASDSLLPREALEKSFAQFDRMLKTLAYAQSVSMVTLMIEKYGWEMIQELISDIARGDSAEETLKRRGMNWYLFEKEWGKSVKFEV